MKSPRLLSAFVFGLAVLALTTPAIAQSPTSQANTSGTSAQTSSDTGDSAGAPASCDSLAISDVGEKHNESSWGNDEKNLVSVERHFCEDSRSRGIEAWRAVLTASSAVPLGDHTAVGPDAITGFWKAQYDLPKFSLRWKPTFAQVVGDIGVTSGPFEQSWQGKSGSTVSVTGTYLTVWQRQKNGEWKLAWDSGSPKSPKH